MSTANILLGSASERRRNILSEMGFDVKIVTAEARELHDSENPVKTVLHNAAAKHIACRKKQNGLPLITADTVVFSGSITTGKPGSFNEAVKFLISNSGKIQHIFTGLTLSMPGEPASSYCCVSSLRFKEIDRTLAEEYLTAAQTLDRAGAYDINTHGKMIIASYSGSYTNIMGLPRAITADWFRARGFFVNSPPRRNHGIPME